MADSQKATAVVVVHGIGKQLPMDTLRGFVETVFGEGSLRGNPPIVRNKVDRHSTFRDLRRLTLSTGDGHARVDFYELYWAPAFGTGTVAGALGWILRLFVSRPRMPQLRYIVWLARLLVTTTVVALSAALWLIVYLGWWAALAPLVPAVGLILFLPRAWVNGVLTEVLADASRWFAPAPADIPERDRVRNLGLDLLQALHESRQSDGSSSYGRIVVVGHSLGSVIAYDVLRIAFDAWREPTTDSTDPKSTQPVAWNFEDERKLLAADLAQGSDAQRRFRHVQRLLAAEQRRMGVPWLVTDFITLGSPLTHAQELWPKSAVGFSQRQRENEFPSCPPVGEIQHRYQMWAKRNVEVPPHTANGPSSFYRRTLSGPLVAHEASVFAATRWTNLFFPMTKTLSGDPVAGPLAPQFGNGVRDIAVRPSRPRKNNRLAIPVRDHTWYWRRDPATTRDDVAVDTPYPDAVKMLGQVIALTEGASGPYRPPSATQTPGAH